ncbi:MAG: hypothetical protein AAGI24_04020 [Pseudomonadota bacterium]
MPRYQDEIVTLGPQLYWPTTETSGPLLNIIGTAPEANTRFNVVGTVDYTPDLSPFEPGGVSGTTAGSFEQLSQLDQMTAQTFTLVMGYRTPPAAQVSTALFHFGDLRFSQRWGWWFLNFEQQLRFSTWSGLFRDAICPVVLPENTTYHLVLRVESGVKVDFFLDGVNVHSEDPWPYATHIPNTAGRHARLGALRNSALERESDQAYAHPAYFDRLLTDQEIATLYEFWSTEEILLPPQRGRVTGSTVIEATPVERDVIALTFAPQPIPDTDPPQSARQIVGETRSGPDGSFTLEFDHTGEVIVLALGEYGTPWAADTVYAVGDRIRPTTGNETGYAYVCTVPGTAGADEPTWWIGAGTTGAVGTATFEAVSTYWPVAHAPIQPEVFDTGPPGGNVPDITVVMDPANTNANLTITNDLEVSGSGSSWKSSLADTSRNTGLFVFEVTLDSDYPATQYTAGVAAPGANINSYVGSEPTSWGLAGDGRIYNSGSFSNSPVRVDDPAETVQVRVNMNANTVEWFDGTNTASANITLTDVLPAVSLFGPSAGVTANFGASPFVHAMPAGFSSWDGSQEA